MQCSLCSLNWIAIVVQKIKTVAEITKRGVVMNQGNTDPGRFDIEHLERNKAIVAQYDWIRLVNPVNNTLATDKIKADIWNIAVFQNILIKELVCFDKIGVVNHHLGDR